MADLGDLIPYMFPGVAYDPATFDPERDQRAVHQTPFAKEYEASNPDLGPVPQARRQAAPVARLR